MMFECIKVHLIKQLFVLLIFSNQSETETLSSLESLKLSDITHLRSATQQEFTFTCSQLTSAARSQLPSIRATYIKAFSYFEKEAFVSRYIFFFLCQKLGFYTPKHFNSLKNLSVVVHIIHNCY